MSLPKLFPRRSSPSSASSSLLENDFAPHFEAYKASPNLDTRANLLKAVNPVINTAVSAFSVGNVGPVVRSQAKQIAMKAFDSYDPTKGKLKSHLMTNLQGLRRFAADRADLIKIPERIRLDRMKLDDATSELRDRLGREPSDHELSQHANISPRRMASIRSMNSGFGESQLGNTYMDEEGNPYEPSVFDRKAGAQHVEFVYDALDDVDKAIVDMHMGRNGRRPAAMTTIAKRLRISPSAVSQRAAKIQAKIDQIRAAGIF